MLVDRRLGRGGIVGGLLWEEGGLCLCGLGMYIWVIEKNWSFFNTPSWRFKGLNTGVCI